MKADDALAANWGSTGDDAIVGDSNNPDGRRTEQNAGLLVAAAARPCIGPGGESLLSCLLMKTCFLGCNWGLFSLPDPSTFDALVKRHRA